MNFRTMRIFQSVCRSGSVTKTAQQLYMTQPAISHAIREIENEYGYPLFERTNRKLILNSRGKQLLKQMEHVLSAYDDMNTNMMHIDEVSSLKIGSSITIANAWLPNVMKQFYQLFPNKKIQVEINQAKTIVSQLQNHEIDIAFGEGVLADDSLEVISFDHYELFVICHKSHPFATLENVSVHALKKERLLLREKGSAIRDTFDALLQLHQEHMEPSWVSVNSQALLQATSANLGVSILPKSILQSFAGQDNLCCIPLKERLYNDFYMAYRKSTSIHSDIAWFIDYIS